MRRKKSVVFCVYFKVALGMVAGGADGRRFRADHDVTAIPALPDFHLTLGKDLGGFHVVKQCSVALLVVLLNGGNQTEFGSQLREALFLSGLGKALIHIRPFVVFTRRRRAKIFSGVSDAV